jgi:hypothetical protein
MTSPTARLFVVGDRVRIERDEARYPSKGTWPRFRGRTGTVVEINGDEHGVVFGAVRRLPGGSVRAADGREVTTWFGLHEIRALASRSRANGL